MPEKPNPGVAYTRALLEARVIGDGFARDAARRLNSAFGAALDGLDLEATTQKMTPARAMAIRAQIEGAMDAIEKASKAATARGVGLTIEQIVELHATTADAIGAAYGVTGMRARFDVVPARALAVLTARRENASTFQTLIKLQREGAAREMDAVLAASVARGLPTAQVAKSLMALLRADDIPGDENAIATMSTAKLKGLQSNLRMIAVTETLNAFRESNASALAVSPIVEAARWQIGGNHQREDACDYLAKSDLYGYGPGYYDPRVWPVAPHPHCGCYQGGPVKYREPSQWRTTKPEPRGPLDKPIEYVPKASTPHYRTTQAAIGRGAAMVPRGFVPATKILAPPPKVGTQTIPTPGAAAAVAAASKPAGAFGVIERRLTDEQLLAGRAIVTSKVKTLQRATLDQMGVLDAELMFRDQKIEHAFIVHADGTIGGHSIGTAHRVNFTAEAMLKARGGIITHNHPNDSVFSLPDLKTSRQLGLAEMRAVVEGGTFSMKPIASWANVPSSFEKQFEDLVNARAKAIVAQHKRQPYASEWAGMMDEIAVLGKKNGLAFTYEPKTQLPLTAAQQKAKAKLDAEDAARAKRKAEAAAKDAGLYGNDDLDDAPPPKPKGLTKAQDLARIKAEREREDMEQELREEEEARNAAKKANMERVAAEKAAKLAAEQAAAARGYRPARVTDPEELPTVQAMVKGENLKLGRVGSGMNDPALGALYKDQGFDGEPEVVSREDIDRFAADGERLLFRGVTETKYLDDLRKGAYYPGVGVYGNGTYTAAHRADAPVGLQQAVENASAEAKAYRGMNGDTVAMTLRKDARTITWREVQDKASTESMKLEDKALDMLLSKDPAVRAKAKELNELSRLYRDPGRWATANGYDAIIAENAGGETMDYVVVLNRTATRISATNEGSRKPVAPVKVVAPNVVVPQPSKYAAADTAEGWEERYTERMLAGTPAAFRKQYQNHMTDQSGRFEMDDFTLQKQRTKIATQRRELVKEETKDAFKAKFGENWEPEHAKHLKALNAIESKWRLDPDSDETGLMKRLEELVAGGETHFHKTYIDHDATKRAAFLKQTDAALAKLGVTEEMMRLVYDTNRRAARAGFRAIYGEKVTVYRGVKGNFAKQVGVPEMERGFEGSMTFNTASSWSTKKAVAQDFADGGYVFEVEVSVDDVSMDMLTSDTFLPEEFEIVVNGAKPLPFKVVQAPRGK